MPQHRQFECQGGLGGCLDPPPGEHVVFKAGNNVFTVLGVEGNTFLGGLDFDAVARSLAAGRTGIWVGYSMGGRIAMDFHDSYPERVASLVLCDSLPGFNSLDDEQRKAFVAARKDPLVAGKSPAEIVEAEGLDPRLRRAGPDAVDREGVR